MPKQLVVISGLERGRVMMLADQDIIQIGCSQSLPVESRFRDPGVARVHCEVQADAGRVVVIDSSGTAQGTFLNGERITRRELKPSDIIRVGQTQIRYLGDSSAEIPVVPAAETVAMAAADEGTAEQPIPTELPPPPAPEVDPLTRLVGRTLGNYKVEVLLGTGYWGRVFRVRDQRAKHIVALKVLCLEFGADPQILPQFSQALKAVLPLRHPNLVNHFSAGKAGPLCWIAMEFVEGKSLTQIINRCRATGQVDWHRALRVAVEASRGLVAAHERNLIHGNLTPQNILLRERDRVTKIGDFMLARTLRSIRVQARNRPDQRPEDVPYMSPERTRSLAEADERSDIYSLGATLYALLTSRPPFEAESCAALVDQVYEIEPVPPSDYVSGLPERFETIILRTLAKQPNQRYQSAAELVHDLEKLNGAVGGETLRPATP
jgi:hypothetical protein